MKHELYIGIDTGVNTGFAVYDATEKKLITVLTLPIHDALFRVENMRTIYKIKVRIEDARLRKWVQGGKEKAQGVGSIKRDAKIWEDYCKDKCIDYEMVAPKNNKTKTTQAYFEKLTGWKFRTSNHARDAAMLVYMY